MIKFFGNTDVGQVRQRNEDSFLIDPSIGLGIVADGMGGHVGGAVASAMATEHLRNLIAAKYDAFSSELRTSTPVVSTSIAAELAEMLRDTSRAIHHRATHDEPDLGGMGTTCVAAWFEQGLSFIVHVGDSRAYLLRDGLLTQVTEDHSLVNEQMRAGLMTEEEAKRSPFKNVITRSVGFDADIPVDVIMLPTLPGDRFLLCSDGLTGHLEADDLHGYLMDSVEDADALEQLNQDMIDETNGRGGDDNITVVCISVESREEDEEEGAEATDPDATRLDQAIVRGGGAEVYS